MAVPSDFGLAYEEEQIQTGSDTSVHGWFIPAANANGRTVVFCHGNGINITYCQPYYQFLHDAGFNVFLYDYRGFGKSWGAVSMDAMLSDMTYVIKARKRMPTKTKTLIANAPRASLSTKRRVALQPRPATSAAAIRS